MTHKGIEKLKLIEMNDTIFFYTRCTQRPLRQNVAFIIYKSKVNVWHVKEKGADTRVKTSSPQGFPNPLEYMVLDFVIL